MFRAKKCKAMQLLPRLWILGELSDTFPNDSFGCCPQHPGDEISDVGGSVWKVDREARESGTVA